MDTEGKLEALKDTCLDEAELNRLLEKLLEGALVQHRRRLERYDQELRRFEEQYGMDSETFQRRFRAGELGDSMVFFEWAGVRDLRLDLVEKIHRLEAAL